MCCRSRKRRSADHILGLILTGIAHYDETIHQTALAVLCRDIFGRDQLSLARKHDIFVRLHKKLLTLLSEPRTGQLTFFNCAAMLNHLYRYTVRQELLEGPFRFPPEKPAAFFPGTFDPFSVGHKQIVQEIRARGFEVYLAVDEFSWSKKTLPKLLRRRIVSISTADQWDTYLFPDEIPVNIAMPEDLARLRQLLPGRDVYLVAGSDVIANASAYKRTEPGTAADYDHIIFCRDGSADRAALTCNHSGKAPASVACRRFMRQSAPRASAPRLTRILISPCLSRRSCRRISMNAACTSALQSRRMCCGAKRSISKMSHRTKHTLPQAVRDCMRGKKAPRAALLLARPARLLGWAAGHTILLDDLYDVLGSLEACSYVRQHASGQILFVDAAQAEEEDALRMLLNELLARSLEQGHTYALCRCSEDADGAAERPAPARLHAGGRAASIMSICATPSCSCRTPCSASSRRTATRPPCARPFCRPGPACAWRSAPCFPGKLLLCFDTELLNQAIAQRIERMNGVQDVPEGVRQLGPYMCVPYGKIFADAIVPNTVTKTLHVEKCYAPDVRSFTIEEYPDYSPLPGQVRTLRVVPPADHSGRRSAAQGVPHRKA